GTISGTVSAEVGELIGEVEVCAKAVDESSFKCVQLLPDGSYKIPELPKGEYKVGFWPTGNYVTQFWQNEPTWKRATPLTVTDVEGMDGVNATLVRGATISGIVTASATGLPVGEVEACATLVEPEPELELERCANTDAAGGYTIDGLAAGVWSLYLYAQNAEADVVSQAYSGGTIEVTAGEPKSGVNVALGPGGQIAGTVRLASTGAPLGGVQVCVTTASSQATLGCLRTPASGAYRFMRIWPGSFKVVFSPEPSGLTGPDSFFTQWWGGQPTFETATPIAIIPPQIVTGIDASLTAPESPTTTPSPAPVVTKPVLKCKRGFVKRKVHGKQRCVKRHKHKPKPRHRHHKSRYQAPQSPPKRL
ncbi:MAG TPA: carboxypeptidase-like regulatory domain-containing protein, partial [Solirubrobacterales bacterium]|nr:carboxypeptidase-like regulatory domain-containing protein [Solirubrobacterales bacterium]